MNQKAVLRVLVFAVAWFLVASMSVLADDSAASIAVGGLVPRRETRIVMAKEVLRINVKTIVVEYDFRNDTDQDVTTEMAFPIPPYTNEIDGPEASEQSFSDFQLEIGGIPVPYMTEAKATLNDKDVTALLLADHIDIPTFGHFVDTINSKHEEVIDSPDFSRLSQATKDQLVKAGIFELDPAPVGQWTVHLQYHWTQIFPAHSTTRIRHEYSPVAGFTQVTQATVEDALAQFTNSQSASGNPEEGKLLAGFCVDQPFLSTLARQLQENASQAKTGNEGPVTSLVFPQWVDFILTSANTWQRPIEDFTLIIERPQPEQGEKILISFCSPADGKVEKLDADHLQVHLTNFVPASELHIGFFEIPQAKAAPPAAK
ncbi:MAG: DUF4424 family protein [Terracidiphilus sp.]|jgi:hypothetical protein